MTLPIYQVDAFSNQPFRGNPAAVCPLETWLDDTTLRQIAAENNLAETAFFIAEGDGFQLRWFTPTREVRLCGHATLATAHVLYERLGFSQARIRFTTLSGDLFVQREGHQYTLDFPAQIPVRCESPDLLAEALGAEPHEVLKTDDYIAVFDDEAVIREMKPDLRLLSDIECRGINVTAPGNNCDYVNRFFAPRYGIDEDPVTGSAHCDLVPYWHQRTGKSRFLAHQVSARGGVVNGELRGERVLLSGQAALYLEGRIHLP